MDSNLYIAPPPQAAQQAASMGTPIPMTATGAAGTSSGKPGYPHIYLWVIVAFALGFIFFSADIKFGAGGRRKK